MSGVGSRGAAGGGLLEKATSHEVSAFLNAGSMGREREREIALKCRILENVDSVGWQN